ELARALEPSLYLLARSRELVALRRFAGRSIREHLLDRCRRRVAVVDQLAESLLLGRVGTVVRARPGRERLRVGDQRVGCELSDARVDLVVARGELLDRLELPADRLQGLGAHGPVRLVVVAQSGQEGRRRPDVGLLDPRAELARLRSRVLRLRVARLIAVCGARPIDAVRGHTLAREAHPGDVDVRAV